jgi:Flp pilus assembly CpaF family ATPase
MSEFISGKKAAETVFSLCHHLAASYDLIFDRKLPDIACRTPDGSRFQGNVGPMIGTGFAVSIRVYRVLDATFDDFHVKPEDQDLIAETVAGGGSSLLSGGTGSGKTTLQNHMITYVPQTERIITVEDTPELRVSHPNYVPMRVPPRQSVSNMGWGLIIESCMRHNPDVLIPGEIRIYNAFPIMQMFDSGEGSVMSTMHSNSPREAIRGLRRRVAMSGGAETELQDLEEFIAASVDLIIQVRHMRQSDDIERRVVTDVVRPKDLLFKSPVPGLEQDIVIRDDVLRMKDLTESLKAAGIDPDDLALMFRAKTREMLADGKLSGADPGADVSLSPEEQSVVRTWAGGRKPGEEETDDGTPQS